MSTATPMVGSCVSFGELLQPPPTSHDLDQLHHHISLQQLGDRLQKAANAAFPNDKRMRYTSVYVLLLLWRDEDPNLPVSLEALELKDVFENVYHFTVEAWEIPSDGSHKRVNQKILDFIELGGDSKDDLKIVYYGGHGMLGSSRQSCWASRPKAEDPSFRTVKWNGIQHALEEAESDVLLLFDCCSSGTANADVGNGVTELIAACGFNANANPVGTYSFTRALITELRMLSTRTAFTVGVLYNKILCRLQNWMPEGREMQKPPLHVVLTHNWKLPRAIQLSVKGVSRVSGEEASEQVTPLSQSSTKSSMKSTTKRRRTESTAPPESTSKRQRTRNSSPKYLNSPSSTLSSQESIAGNLFEPNSSISSASSLSSQEDLGPRIALTIRLKETIAVSEASSDLFAEWMRMMPLSADHVKIEAGFSSFSTLLILSLTIPLWCYLQDHPAISLAGIIKTSNQVTTRPALAKTLCSETITQRDSDSIAISKPTPKTLKWGQHAEALIQFYKFSFVEKDAYFGLLPGIKSTATLPKRVYLENAISPEAPYNCWFAAQCPKGSEIIFEDIESLAMHYIVCHSDSEPNISSSNGSTQLASALLSSNSRNQDVHQVSCSTNAKAQVLDESTSLQPILGLESSKDNGIGKTTPSEKPRGEQPPPASKTEVRRPVSPTILTWPDYYGLSFEYEALIKEARHEVESEYPSTTGKPKAVESQQRSKKLFSEQQAHQGQIDPRLPSTSVARAIVDEPAPISEKNSQFQIHASPTLKSCANQALRDDQDKLSSLNSARRMSLSSTTTSLPSLGMGRPYSDASTSSASFSVSSTYTSNGFHDPGYYSQNQSYAQVEEDPIDIVLTKPTASTLGWLSDTERVHLYDFFAPKSQSPYFKLKLGLLVTPECPQRVYLDTPKNPKKGEHPCQYPSTICAERAPFKRPADLQRHYQNVHASGEARDEYFCDYTRCTRNRNAFSRKDHYRNHLKEYHKEDLGRAQGHRTLTKKAWITMQSNWLDERQISAKWWRCSKCLSRIQIATEGFECPHCKSSCEKERADRIENLRGGKRVTTEACTPDCDACGDTAWIWDEGKGAWFACTKCGATKDFEDIDEGLGC